LYFRFFLCLISCEKLQYESKSLTYSIEYNNEVVIHNYNFSGNDNATAKVFHKEKDGWKWNQLMVSPNGKEYSLLVHSTIYKINIISLKDFND